MNAAAWTLLMMTSALGQLPASPDPKPVPIAGVVADESGRPMANADLWLAEAIPTDEGRQAGAELWYTFFTSPGEGAPPILVHGRSDGAGRFALEVPAEAVARRSPPPMVVWAAAPGREARVAFRRLPRIVLADDPPVPITLGPPGHAVLTALTPDRKPAAGARVVPTRAGEVPIPEPLGRALAATADAGGRVAIAGLGPAAIGEVRVEADGFGVQILRIPDPGMQKDTDQAVTIALAPVGRIAGRLVAPGKEPIRGVTVRATSQVEGYAGSGVRGTAAAACDDQGRFAIPAIAAGTVALELVFDPTKGPLLRGEEPRRLIVKVGQATEVTIPMRETVRVRGFVREKGTDRPIPGVKIVLNAYYSGDRFVTTDAAGRFTGRILRDVNQPSGWPIRFPSPFFEPADGPQVPQGMPRRGVAELELPPIELRRGADVRGIVAGEDGEPVDGAEVEAIWYGPEGQAQVAMARSDRAGGFVLHGIDPIAELNLTAWDGFSSTAAVTVRAATAEHRQIALTLSTRDTVPIGGRVVDPDGRPITGVSIRLWREVRSRNGRIVLEDPVATADGAVLHTGADGRYRTRGRFPAQGEYHAEATAPGRVAARSRAVAVARDADRPAVLVLRRVRAVEGRVVDRRGRPIAGALVRQSGDGPMPTETLTADDGRFRLPGVIEGSGIVLAEKAGFRTALQPAEDASKPVEIVLARADEPPAVAYRTIVSTLPVAEEKALGRRLIQPLAAKVLAHGDDNAKYRFLVDASAIDPNATIEWLDRARFGDPEAVNRARLDLAAELARENLDEATTIIEAIGSANWRARGYLVLLDEAPNLTAERKRALLGQAALNSKTITSLDDRFGALGEIADRLIDLGDVERARAVLKEGRELAGGLARGDKGSEGGPLYLAEPLARLDLPAALKIVEGFEQDARKDGADDRGRIYGRYYALIALKLADRSPADAEKVVGRMDIRPSSDREVVAICARMALKDVARARRIAATRLSPDAPTFRPYALGLMARAIVPTDRAEAVRLLDEAFAELERLSAMDSPYREPDTATVAGALLPAVEQSAPDRLAEFLARAVLMRHARGDRTARGESDARSTTMLAALAARYDRDLAARILQPALDRAGSLEENFGWDLTTRNVLGALALIDPRRAVAMVEAIPEDPEPDDEGETLQDRARRLVAKLLALHGDDRWKVVHQQLLWLWIPELRYF